MIRVYISTHIYVYMYIYEGSPWGEKSYPGAGLVTIISVNRAVHFSLSHFHVSRFHVTFSCDQRDFGFCSCKGKKTKRTVSETGKVETGKP
jgi:hypothetical protein